MIHFTYRAPRPSDLVGRIRTKIALTFPWISPPWRSGDRIKWTIPKRHPLSASYNLIKEFKKRGEVKFYDLWEKKAADVRPGDKFLGLPIQVYDGRSWDDPTIDCVTRKTLERYPDLDATLILPYCHDARYNASTNGLIERYGRNLVILSGKYWTDTWDQSPIKKYVRNLLRVNMGVDMSEYPQVKKSFNPPGKRKFLYIGQTAWYKNTAQLEAIAAAMPGFEGGYISTGEIKGWKKISSWAGLTPDYMAQIAAEYDFFVNVSSADPSPTTIVESMCFGFPIACTPESSYEYDCITRLHITDTAFNVAQLTKLQNADESVLREMARRGREIVARDHDWAKIAAKIADFTLNRPKDANGLFIVD